MYVHPFHIDGRLLIAASMSEGRIQIADTVHRKLRYSIQLRENCNANYDVTHDGRYLAAGYWDARGVDVWDLRSLERVYRVGPAQVSGVRFDATGRYLTIRSKRGSCVCDLRADTLVPFLSCGSLQNEAALDASSNTLFVPSRRRAELLQITFDPINIRSLHLPFSRTIACVAVSRGGPGTVVTDVSGRLSCFAELSGDPLWSVELRKEDRTCEMAWSGNGRYIGLSIGSWSTKPFRTIVLDAGTGQRVGMIEGVFGGEFSMEGPEIMTFEGKVINLESGAVNEELGKAAWWLALDRSDAKTSR